MAIVAADIVVYGSASMPEDGATTCGGAIDLTTRIIPEDADLWNVLGDTVDAVSSNAGDTTQTVTVYGRNAAGVVVNEVLNLNGTTPATGATTFQSILKIVINASHAGTVTVTQHTGDVELAVMPTGELTIRRPYYNVSADVSGGSSRSFYEKVFYKNTNVTNAVLGATMVLTTNTTGNRETFALSAAINDSVSSANNTTAPAALSFDTADKAVPGTDLGPGDAIGLWRKLTLPAGTAATNTSDTYTLTGSTTP